MAHKYKDNKCECGCELRIGNVPKRGTVRTYSFDGFETVLYYSPPCNRPMLRLTKAEKMRIYRKNNKEKIREYFKMKYQERKKKMFKEMIGV